MDSITAEELRRFAPSARTDYIDALVQGWGHLEQAQVNNPSRVAAFLAECAHETGGFTIVRENMSYTAARMCEVWPSRFKGKMDPRAQWCAGQPERLAEAVYGGRLGNAQRGDGFLFRGGGFLQMTGRAGFREYGRMVGVDLETNPELIERADISLLVALAVWVKHGLNRFADRHYMRAVGNAINRGNPYSSLEPIGHAGRRHWFERAKIAGALLYGEEGLKVPPGLALGAHGPQVETVQRQLRDLGYGVGKVDKVFGAATARAVAAFKLDHKRASGRELEPDEVVGPLTRDALEQGKPVVVSEERAATTAKQLAAEGSTEVAVGLRQKAAGVAVTTAAFADGARQTGMFEMAQESIGVLPQWHGLMAPVISAVQWGLAHLFWLVALLFGVWVWSGGHKTVLARLKAHRFGFNLFR